ncbi:hypothetical protein [Arthrobacter sp. StoSoilB22]|uniref:hypothetical protein n=1 Tax=Arthrobacter sp. StoSoilB22 TaxID=2830996 RepID=UPI001CC4E635|nr:hypothetical protein [Arthrobacter sp. StoSoilB22]BCW62474.1 hypothetical protein StoSoilB22_14470 [Arthrobacter sp. StoSoilB22]
MSISAETWGATADGVHQIVAEIDAGREHGTPEQRAFLAGVVAGLRDHKGPLDPLPDLSDDAVTALRNQIEDLQERIKNGHVPAATDGGKPRLDLYAAHLHIEAQAGVGEANL